MELVKQNTSRGLSSSLAMFLQWGIGVIFVIAPFYAPLTVALASHFNHFDLLRIWKELALTGLALVMTWFLITHRKRAMRVLKDKLLLSMLIYAAVILIIGIYDLISHRVGQNAVIYGWLINLRLVGFFGVAFLAFSFGNLYKTFPWQKLILIPAVVVIGFGLLQATVLPKDILTHIGYSKQTIVPFQTVDSRPEFVRVQSTLRGANPLGAYLVVIITLAISLILGKPRKQKLNGWLFAFAGMFVLYRTYSRSAWVGTLLSLAVLTLTYEGRLIGKKNLLIGAGLLVVIVALFPIIRNNYQAQNILFHSSSSSLAPQSSNAGRAVAIKAGLNDIINNPLGSGVGSAGPASLRNTKNAPRIAENYFLQLGQEVGILGLSLFIFINILLVHRLWHRKDDALSRALLASFMGLIFINMVSHAWSDDTLAYIWWGLAGIALTPVILDKKRKNYGPSHQAEK